MLGREKGVQRGKKGDGATNRGSTWAEAGAVAGNRNRLANCSSQATAMRIKLSMNTLQPSTFPCGNLVSPNS